MGGNNKNIIAISITSTCKTHATPWGGPLLEYPYSNICPWNLVKSSYVMLKLRHDRMCMATTKNEKPINV